MATYVYECPEHGQFEVSKPMADSGHAEECPIKMDSGPYETCGRSTRRVFTSSAIHPQGFSGDGYAFDSKSGARSKGKKNRWV